MVNRLMDSNAGLGCANAHIAVYIANTPPMSEYQQLNSVNPMAQGEISVIGQACGNGWRKVFNVYAKLLYALDKVFFSFSKLEPTWQLYRDNYLLQGNSNTALMFSPPCLQKLQKIDGSQKTDKPQEIEIPKKTIHIVMGRTYAKSLIKLGYISQPLTWLDDEFAINVNSRIIVCPYFDYRQLSNIKIEYLAGLIKRLN